MKTLPWKKAHEDPAMVCYTPLITTLVFASLPCRTENCLKNSLVADGCLSPTASHTPAPSPPLPCCLLSPSPMTPADAALWSLLARHPAALLSDSSGALTGPDARAGCSCSTAWHRLQGRRPWQPAHTNAMPVERDQLSSPSPDSRLCGYAQVSGLFAPGLARSIRANDSWMKLLSLRPKTTADQNKVPFIIWH